MDTSKTYTVEGHGGIAFNFIGYSTRTDYDTGEEIESEDEVIMVMVGDDRKFYVDPAECKEIAEEAYCHECGQIGCSMNINAD